MSSRLNTTTHERSISKDLLFGIPHFLSAVSSFALDTLPEQFDRIFNAKSQIIAEATGKQIKYTSSTQGSQGINSTSAAATLARDTIRRMAMEQGVEAGTVIEPTSLFSVTVQQIRAFGGIFMYATSRWALSCIALAIVLNRTQVYATGRRRVSLGWPVRLALRIIPIILFANHALYFIQAIRCQTSPSYSQLRDLDPSQAHTIDFSGQGGFLYHLTSWLFFWTSDANACQNLQMSAAKGREDAQRGSFASLWPFFQALCLGQFVETLSCAVQGRRLMTEIGISVFEHSLAFAEAQGMLANLMGLSPFGNKKIEEVVKSADDPAAIIISSRLLFDQLNAPAETLFMSLISSLNNLSSHVLAVFDLQARFRLLNTSIWGMLFMTSISMVLLNCRNAIETGTIVLRFPTVCIVTFIPHLLILCGILICATILFFAMLLNFLSPPHDLHFRTLRERWDWAKGNLQIHAQMPEIGIHMHQDFFTALVKVGLTALTAASEAVYLNEWGHVNVASRTWLEEERFKELENCTDLWPRIRQSGTTARTKGDNHDDIMSLSTSGYARQRTTDALKSSSHNSMTRRRTDGVGHLQRGSRYLAVYEYWAAIQRLFAGICKALLVNLLDKLHIRKRPQWLQRPSSQLALKTGRNVPGSISSDSESRSLEQERITRLLMDHRDGNKDGTRRETQESDPYPIDFKRGQSDAYLYYYAQNDALWDDQDGGSSYSDTESQCDIDRTSMISDVTSTASLIDADEDDTLSDFNSHSQESGLSTPTQTNQDSPRLSQDDQLEDRLFEPARLAQLLDPKDDDSRLEAQILAKHLTSPGVMTRAQFRAQHIAARAKVLTSTRFRPPSLARLNTDAQKLTSEEEARLLEELLLERRTSAQTRSSSSPSNSTPSHAKDYSSGPQCVVCQTAPRIILAWPCKCLSLCEECRVSLAMNNFGTCVCCRRDVVGFSRLYVP